MMDAIERNHVSWNAFHPYVSFANYLECTPGFTFGPRITINHQFIYVANGAGIAQIQNRRYEATAGDLFHYGPSIVHRFEADRTHPFTLYGIHFSLNDSFPDNGMFSGSQVTNVTDMNFQADWPNRLFIGEDAGRIEVPERINDGRRWIEPFTRELVEHFEKREKRAHLYNRAVFTRFLLTLSDRTSALPPSPNSARTEPVMNILMENLKRHAHMAYDRTWLREWTNYHENHAAHLFTRQFGRSPHSFFMEQKLLAAKDLLAESNLTVGEIANRLHLGSIHYFSLLFKRETGQSPSEYRKLRRSI